MTARSISRERFIIGDMTATPFEEPQEDRGILGIITWVIAAALVSALAVFLALRPGTEIERATLVLGGAQNQATSVDADIIESLQMGQKELAERLEKIEAAFGPLTGSLPQGQTNPVWREMTAVEQVFETPESTTPEDRTIEAANAIEGSTLRREPSSDLLLDTGLTGPDALEVSDTQLAALPPLEVTGPALDGPIQIEQTQFGLQLGDVTTLAAGVEFWRVMTARHGDILASFSPIIAMQETDTGALSLSVIAGPVQNAGDAAQLCARFSARGEKCKTTLYDGQRLALR